LGHDALFADKEGGRFPERKKKTCTWRRGEAITHLLSERKREGKHPGEKGKGEGKRGSRAEGITCSSLMKGKKKGGGMDS